MSLNVHRKSILLPMQTHPACSTFFKSLGNNSPGTILLPETMKKVSEPGFIGLPGLPTPQAFLCPKGAFS
jgi:hypothetical protein